MLICLIQARQHSTSFLPSPAIFLWFFKMIDLFESIKQLILVDEIKISEHGYDELADDDIFVKDIIYGIQNAELLEEYPRYHKGPCVLVLEKDRNGKPIHVVWGVPRGRKSPAVLITAYRPDPNR